MHLPNQTNQLPPVENHLPEEVDFDGEGYVRQRDQFPLTKQLHLLFNLMRDGKWRSLEQINQATCIPEASASAGLRDFRKKRNGSYTVDRVHVGNRLYMYRLRPPGHEEIRNNN
jgi:hypothetical protein